MRTIAQHRRSAVTLRMKSMLLVPWRLRIPGHHIHIIFRRIPFPRRFLSLAASHASSQSLHLRVAAERQRLFSWSWLSASSLLEIEWTGSHPRFRILTA